MLFSKKKWLGLDITLTKTTTTTTTVQRFFIYSYGKNFTVESQVRDWEMILFIDYLQHLPRHEGIFLTKFFTGGWGTDSNLFQYKGKTEWETVFKLDEKIKFSGLSIWQLLAENSIAKMDSWLEWTKTLR